MSAEAYQRLLSLEQTKKRKEIRERANQLRRTFTFLPMKKIVREVTAAQREFERLARSNHR